jgi:hypothetical protein
MSNPNPEPNPNQVRLLAPTALEELRLLEDVDGTRISAGLRESVEAAAVILGVRPDFSTAQAWPPCQHGPRRNASLIANPSPSPNPDPSPRPNPSQARLMPKEGAFQERLLCFDRGAVPPAARMRLRRFVDGEGGGGAGGTAAGKAAAPAGLDAVEAALRTWCTVLLRHRAAMDEAEMAREQTSCTPAMQADLPTHSPTPNPTPTPTPSPTPSPSPAPSPTPDGLHCGGAGGVRVPMRPTRHASRRGGPQGLTTHGHALP